MTTTIEGLRKRVSNFLDNRDNSRREVVFVLDKAQQIARRINNANNGSDDRSVRVDVSSVDAKQGEQRTTDAIPVDEQRKDRSESQALELASSDGRKLIAKI